ncbi:hypothetical protein PAT3040_02812 [Paenibacillus agaridevorans]|uniref:Uncharacterized protein n=1 Tax=Paenibacillus agaridevorans TaxID=171404 RepID=A0A2R5ENJ0_9BACL|nr:UPF0158 family protein [Paenibacillus agaridevorans]GBG08240.1 hypothetical protein PAT3040_02812 [Paenibacillus agaridevorans]
MQQIKITQSQFEELIFACENTGHEIIYYFDKQTGEVEMLGEYIENDPELEERIEDEFGERYIRVPMIESWQSFEDMVAFTETVGDMRMKHSLEHALSGGKGVFRRFKDSVSDDSRLLEEWYKFKDQKNRERVVKVLEEEELIKLIIE